MRRVVLSLVAVGLLAAAWIVPASAETPPAPYTLPGAVASLPTGSIDHLVVIVEENSTFDHVLGWLPGVNGHGVDQYVRQAGGRQVKWKGFSKLGPDTFVVPHGKEVLDNGPTAARQSFDHGKMDGFYRAQRAAGKNPQLSFTDIDQAANAPWGILGHQGVVFDRYFSSAMAGSLPNTLNLVAGTAAGRNSGASADFRSLWNSHIPTIFDAAKKTLGVSWRYYIGGLGQIESRRSPTAHTPELEPGHAEPALLGAGPVDEALLDRPGSSPRTSGPRTIYSRMPRRAASKHLLRAAAADLARAAGRVAGPARAVDRERDPHLAALGRHGDHDHLGRLGRLLRPRRADHRPRRASARVPRPDDPALAMGRSRTRCRTRSSTTRRSLRWPHPLHLPVTGTANPDE